MAIDQAMFMNTRLFGQPLKRFRILTGYIDRVSEVSSWESGDAIGSFWPSQLA